MARIPIQRLLFVFGMLAAAGAVGYTYATYNDQEKAGVVFSEGTLDLNLSKDGQAGADAVWSASNLLPGQEVEGEIKLDNSGNVPIESIMFSADSE